MLNTVKHMYSSQISTPALTHFRTTDALVPGGTVRGQQTSDLPWSDTLFQLLQTIDTIVLLKDRGQTGQE